MTASNRYDPALQLLHWLMAALIIGLTIVGVVMEDLPKGELRGAVFNLHKGFGVVVLGLLGLRLAWRLTHAAPALPASMPPREQLAAEMAHFALYVLMAAIPIAGILMSQSGGRAVAVLGWTLPTLVGKDEGIHELFEEVHSLLAWTLLVVVVLHVAAALRHQVLLKDGVLFRMLPWRP